MESFLSLGNGKFMFSESQWEWCSNGAPIEEIGENNVNDFGFSYLRIGNFCVFWGFILFQNG